eukprot:5615749-Pleurochrysis_carterae.AAC.1
MYVSRSSTGVCTGSASATPVKSSMYTCKNLGCAFSPPSPPPPTRAPAAPSTSAQPAAAGVLRQTALATPECRRRPGSTPVQTDWG